MNEELRKKVVAYVEKNIGNFHQKRLDSLSKLKLNTLLKRKNPYLFRAKNILIASDLVRLILDAHLSSQEETIFGDFLESLAIYINGIVFSGRKSATTGIDLEFDQPGKRYLVSIKSGPNWGNSSQIKKMTDNFKTATKVVRQKNKDLHVITVNGCCYGQDANPDKGDYFKYCGQAFWEFISGEPDFYLDIVKPLGHQAKQKNEEFLKQYAKIVHQFSLVFMQDFCTDNEIDWNKLVAYNSKQK